jgi:uncharacterized protein YozE (UPF0346 family)
MCIGPSKKTPEGQLISKQIYAVLNFPKMQPNIARISALAFKMGQIQKVKANYHPISDYL